MIEWQWVHLPSAGVKAAAAIVIAQQPRTPCIEPDLREEARFWVHVSPDDTLVLSYRPRNHGTAFGQFIHDPCYSELALSVDPAPLRLIWPLSLNT